MSLSNSEYAKIKRIYDERQSRRRYDLDLRRKEIARKIPEYMQIEDELISSAICKAKLAAMGEKIDTDNSLNEQVKKTEADRQRLLVEKGYPKDYLEEKYVCKLCKDTGYIREEKCSCFKQAIVDMVYEQSNLKNILEKENFDFFKLEYYSDEKDRDNSSPRENAKKVVTVVKAFIKDFDKNNDNLLFYGKSGVGKTFMTNCIAKELLDKGYTVIYFTAYKLFNSLAKAVFSNGYNADEDNGVSEHILNCDLLIIDDLGTELSNSFTSSQLFQCVNERMLRGKSTIISTNLTLAELAAEYTERTFSRICSGYKLLRLFGKDIRMEK